MRTASFRFPPSAISSGTRESVLGLAELEVAEGLRVRHVPRSADGLRPRAHTSRELVAPADLRLVRPERRDLLVERARDVEPDVGLARPEEQDARDSVMFEAVPQLLRKEQVVARRDHAVHAAPSRDAVIGMDLVVAPRIVGEHDVRLVFANGETDLAAEVHRTFELPVLVPQEDEAVHADA